MQTWIPIAVAALVVVDLVAKKYHWTKVASLVERLENLAQGK